MPASRSALEAAFILAVVLVAAVLAYHSVLSLEHLGWDTYPMIVTSRVQTVGDALGNFTESLMDGRYPYGDFYRPATNWSLALDYALWGAAPFGYHLTDLLILLTSTALVFFLGRRLLGNPWAAGLAGAVFALHPLHFESLPVTARRADALAGLFTLAALIALPSMGRSETRTRHVLTALFVVLAVASKETGIVAVPLLASLAWLETPAGSGRRLVRCGRLCAAGVVAAALFAGIRTIVLGGPGGHEASSLAGGWTRAPGVLRDYGAVLLVPQPLVGDGRSNALITAGLAAAFIVAILLVALARSTRPPKEPVDPRAALVFLCVWPALLVVLTGMSGELQIWYALAFLPAYSLLTGLLVAGLLHAARSSAWRVVLPVALVLATLVGTHVRYSGLFHSYEQWERLSDWERRFLDDFRARAGPAPPSSAIVLPGLPVGLRREGRVGVRGASGMGVYSLQAWADLEFPGRNIRVERHDGRPPRIIDPEETVVAVSGGAPPPRPRHRSPRKLQPR